MTTTLDIPAADPRDDLAAQGNFGPAADAINIPENQLRHGIQDYDQADQDALLHLFAGCRARGIGRTKLCELLGYDYTTVTRVAAGKYPGSLANFMVRVRQVNDLLRDTTSAGFIATPVTAKIHGLLDYALTGDLTGGRLVILSAPSGRSKTTAIREWQRLHNHGATVYIDCPVGGGLSRLLAEIAAHSGINAKRNVRALEDRIAACYDRRRTLILDEAARLIPHGRSHATERVDFIRRLHDSTGCPVCLCLTPVDEEDLRTGRLATYFEQLIGRAPRSLRIPPDAFPAEVRAFLTAHGGDPADPDLLALATRVANAPGRLRVLAEVLQTAAKIARKRKTPLNAQHLQAALARREGLFTFTTKETE